jgi:hypothetical protein
MKSTPTENYFPKRKVLEERASKVEKESLRILGTH